MKYQVWLDDFLIAETLTYKLAHEIFSMMRKKHKFTSCSIINKEDNSTMDSFNCF